MRINRPEKSDYPEYYEKYIAKVAGNPLDELVANHKTLRRMVSRLSRKQLNYRYAEGKWTIKEILVHLIDGERVFCYRALRFARKDTTPLPGFEENEWVPNSNSEKEILFKKNNKSISIDKLSTGEKQIVFRGIYLLKNNKKLNGSAIMVDEPELSMHPKWQKNILKYYKDLFTEANTQKTQLFIATHSEHVLIDALKDKTKNLVIALNDINGVIHAKRIDAPSVLPSITSAESIEDLYQPHAHPKYSEGKNVHALLLGYLDNSKKPLIQI